MNDTHILQRKFKSNTTCVLTSQGLASELPVLQHHEVKPININVLTSENLMNTTHIWSQKSTQTIFFSYLDTLKSI